MSLRPHHNQYSSNSFLPNHVRDGEGGYYQETTMLYVLSILKDKDNVVDNGVMSENSFLLLPPLPTYLL